MILPAIRTRPLIVFLFSLLFTVLLDAQYQKATDIGTRSVTCSSDDYGRQSCGVDTSNGINLEKQLSTAPCTQGATWGFDSGHIWVDKGCRAIFRLGPPVQASLASPNGIGTDQSASEQRSGGLLAADDSPLAVIEDFVYAVSTDHAHLLRAQAGTMGWSQFAAGASFRRVSGLSSRNDFLFVADTASGIISSISVSTGEERVIHKGDPVSEPGAIAVFGNRLYAWDLKGGLYAIDLEANALSSIPLGARLPRNGKVYLAASSQELVISSPEDGLLFKLSYPASLYGSKLTTYFCQESAVDCKDPRLITNSGQFPPDVLPQLEKLTAINRPGPVAYRDGVLFLLDERVSQIFVFSADQLRPIRLFYQKDAVGRPVNFALLKDAMAVLDAATGKLVFWPRCEPVSIVVDVQTSESLAALYNYLYIRGILPVKVTKLHLSVETTLRKERVLLGPYVSSLDPLICGLNPGLCKKGKINTFLLANEDIVVPDLYSESFVEVRPVKLNGTDTLNREVLRRIKSDELRPWADEARLERLNPKFKVSMFNSIRAQTSGQFNIPVELVRYFAAVPRKDLNDPSSEIASLRERYKDDLTIISLVEKASTPQQDNLSSYVIQQNKESFKTAYLQLLKTINYIHPTAPVTPYVGIAEDDVDCDNPDFDGACSPLIGDLASTPQSIPARISNPVKAIRDFEILDHGTAVVGLIGARQSQVESIGLAAPESFVVPLPSKDPYLSDGIKRAYLRQGTTIFNLSLSFDERPESLAQVVDANAKYSLRDALFIVAAPDDGSAECGDVVKYPICWADQPNVIGVAPTLVDGSNLMPTTGNGQWGKKFVQLAAPGIGFGAPARNHTYVPVPGGGSFAAPLVTAAAVLAYEQSVREPWQIKERLIATATPITAYSDKVQGGLLNVKRAVTNVTSAVLINDADEEKIVQLTHGQFISLDMPTGEPLMIPLSSLLRLTRDANGDGRFRAVYQDPGDTHRVSVSDGVSFTAKSPWKIKYSTLVSGVPRIQEDKLSNYKDYFGPIL